MTKETQQTKIMELETKPGGWELEVITSAGNKVITTRKRLEEDYPGMSAQQIGERIDSDFEESDKQLAHMLAQEDNHVDTYGQDHEDDLYDDPIEDPLAGDVDKVVHPDETSGPSGWGDHEIAARQHGDYTG